MSQRDPRLGRREGLEPFQQFSLAGVGETGQRERGKHGDGGSDGGRAERLGSFEVDRPDAVLDEYAKPHKQEEVIRPTNSRQGDRNPEKKEHAGNAIEHRYRRQVVAAILIAARVEHEGVLARRLEYGVIGLAGLLVGEYRCSAWS